ncbi:hypothetical protein PPTG_09977 [Phytophthora nicotianae INRA-310]|uniref:Uncharacterized protein n=1 Tax=Phytophthora nicotianae (strain INRA-310) TaxID=761204 RepID=W2QEK1_PHYN3|nr:hypothetical protein PPTG_09977 [Phytophthora nicotianae INRA-310]ETN10949.1 hypothetical protein PPTG_09977 [Phytophthora nicotianae INRA-310]
MAVPAASAAAASPAFTAPSPRSPTVRPVVLPSDSLVAPPTSMASPASSESHTSDEVLLASFLYWGPDSDFGSRAHARSRARSSTPPAPTEVAAVLAAMVDAPAVAVTLPSPTASATPHDASTSSPPSALQEHIYEITVEGLCGDYVDGDVADDDSVAAEDVALQAVGLLNDEDEEDTQ